MILLISFVILLLKCNYCYCYFTALLLMRISVNINTRITFTISSLIANFQFSYSHIEINLLELSQNMYITKFFIFMILNTLILIIYVMLSFRQTQYHVFNQQLLLLLQL